MKLGAFVAVAASLFAFDVVAAMSGDVYYWKGGDWGDFGTAANWSVGSVDSDVTGVPGPNDMIYVAGTMKIDLGGQTYTVAGAGQKKDTHDVVDGLGEYLHLTNGTLNVSSFIAKFLYPTVWEGASLNFGKIGDSGIHWGTFGRAPYAVKEGGAMSFGTLKYQGLKMTIDAGGFFSLVSTALSEHPTGDNANNYGSFDIYGRAELPYGVTFADGWYVAAVDSRDEAPNGAIFSLKDGGELLVGGDLKRTSISNPLKFHFDGGTLVVSNDVTVLDNARLYFKVNAGKTVTFNVLEDASLTAMRLTGEEGSKIVKTGAGKLVLGRNVLPELSVSEGTLEAVLGSAVPSALAFAEGTTLRLATTGVRFDTVTAYDGLACEIDDALKVPGAVALVTADDDFRAAVCAALNTSLAGSGFGAAVIGEKVVVGKSAAHQFDASQSSDLSDPAAWGGTLPTANDDVVISGAGTAVFNAETTKFKSMSVQFGATLEVEGGSLETPVDLPPLELDYEARLLIADGAVAQLTNVFTTVGDAQTLPVFEIATNATILVQTPGELPCKSFDGGNRKDWGFRLKNVALRWYGNLQMALEDTANKTGYESRLTLGYAASDETSYIAVDCRGGTWTASGEGNYAARCRTPLAIVFPDAGGTVVPVGTLLFRDFKRVNRKSSDGLQSYACPGMLIGANEKTSNPPSVDFDVVFDGTTELTTKGANIIGGGAHVKLAGAAKWTYPKTAWNDDSLVRYLSVYQLGTLEVSDGAYLETVPTSNNARGIRLNGDAQEAPALAVRDASISTLNWSGSGVSVGEFDGATLKIGVQRYKASETLANRTAVFAGLKEAQLGADGLTVVAANVWREKDHTSAEKDVDWTREVTMGIPLSGVGGLSVSNELPAAATVPGMTVFVTNGANTATGVARACETATGPANLVFADGANWAGTVVANAGLSLTNLTDGAAAATVSFGSVEGAMPIRVWKTGGVIAANDKVNVTGTAAAFDFVAMDEPLSAGDTVELGLYPENAALPANTRHIEYSSVASETAGFVTLRATSVKPGILVIIR